MLVTDSLADWLAHFAGDSCNPPVRSCLPEVVWAAAMSALGADVPAWGTLPVGHTGLLAPPDGVVESGQPSSASVLEGVASDVRVTSPGLWWARGRNR